MKYRITSSINDGWPEIQAAFAKRGIVDYCNALPPRARKRHVQVFVYADGSVGLADSRIVRDVAREINQYLANDQA